MSTRLLRAILLCAWALVAAGALAERRPVLAQIDLPHSYYYREMYLPQLTTGPSGVSFSPDSREVVYSMAGSLWRQRLDSMVAVQLTDGPGYDYQPDWSPDGRSIVYVTYAHDAIELSRLDLQTGQVQHLTDNHAVNLEPRWSPDGTRIAYVSTEFHGRFHVYTAEVSASGLIAPTRLTGEERSPLRRYYYSAYDHELSPVWTRDGRSIIYVSNRGHVHGTGGFWQMEAKAGAPAREIHYEETNWRARPDVSPDGSRLLYSSYLGRNGHQLWWLPVAGGEDALPVSYGNWDEVAARWSPDGRLMAFISNRAGNLELWLQDVRGGAQRRLRATSRKYLAPTGRIYLRLFDGAGSLLPGRVSVTDARGRAYAPNASQMHADDSYDRAERPFEAHYFHSGGEDVVDVPAGKIRVEVLHGFGRPLEVREITVASGEAAEVISRAGPAFSMATSGGQWVSGDVHVHMNYGGLYLNTPTDLLHQAEAEDLALVNALVVNKEQRVPDIAQSGRRLDPLSGPNGSLLHGQEFHTSYWGHLGILGLKRSTILPGYAGYPNTAASSLYPMNADVADIAHANGALVGYVHPFDDPPHPFDTQEALSNELPVDVALGKVDYLEVLGFSDHRTTADVWYRLLNLGFRLPAAAGTDAMADFASLRGPVGMNRVYVRVEKPTLDVDEWLAALKAGRSFATNGPLLDFSLESASIGGELALPAGRGVGFRASLHSIVPLDHLEVVCNGRVVSRLKLTGARTEFEGRGTLPVKETGWCLLRASSDGARYPVLDGYVYATTSPIYLTVAGRPHRSQDDAAFFLAWIARVREATERHPDWNSPAEKAGVLAQLDAASRVYEQLRK